MHDESHETTSDSRREFLKKAGAVAWVVPTLQIVNMASAGAQTTGSMVTTTPPPSTTTTTTTTTKPPGCQEYITCTIKADWGGNGYSWSDGSLGAKPCVDVVDSKCNGADLGVTISGDERSVTVTVPEGCEIIQASHKSGAGEPDDYCTMGTKNGRSVTFSAEYDDRKKDISNIQLLVKCCADDLVQR